MTSFALYRVLFSLEIFVAEFLLAFRLKKRSIFILRFSLCVIAVSVLAFFFPIPVENMWYTSFAFFTLFALTVPCIKVCFKERWVNIFFVAIAAYTLQHLAYEVTSLALSAISWGTSPILGVYSNETIHLKLDTATVLNTLIYLLCYVVSFWLAFFIFGKKLTKGREMKVKSVSLLAIISVGLVVDIVLNSVLIYGEHSPVNVAVESVYSILCCMLLLYAQFALLETTELRDKIAVVEQLLRQGEEQYAVSKENIDIINMKCHDMRHQIREIGKNNSLPQEAIREIEDAIRLYDTGIKTGNEVLDIILTEKSLHCHSNGITLSCIADGALLGFMDDVDLYSLFGNALDNAIEAVMKIEDSEKRIISVKLHSVGGLITLNIKNSFTGQINFNTEGLPETSKADKYYHGFGMKSISYIVAKYGGDFAVVVKDGTFNVNILLPNKQNTK